MRNIQGDNKSNEKKDAEQERVLNKEWKKITKSRQNRPGENLGQKAAKMDE